MSDVKQRQRLAWPAGDYRTVAARLQIVSEMLGETRQRAARWLSHPNMGDEVLVAVCQALSVCAITDERSKESANE